MELKLAVCLGAEPRGLLEGVPLKTAEVYLLKPQNDLRLEPEISSDYGCRFYRPPEPGAVKRVKARAVLFEALPQGPCLLAADIRKRYIELPLQPALRVIGRLPVTYQIQHYSSGS